MGLLKSLTPISLKKINFFTRVIDLNVQEDLRDNYSDQWINQWNKILAQNTFNDTPLMYVSAGQSHSLVVNSKGKIFTWGSNQDGQIAQNSSINKINLLNKSKNVRVDNIEPVKYKQIKEQGRLRIKQALTVKDRCTVLIQDVNEIISWGGQMQGQLKISNNEDPNNKIMYIAAGGDLNLACSENGDAFKWQWLQIQNNINQLKDFRVNLGDQMKIQKVSCGDNFGFFISDRGDIFQIGEINNNQGQPELDHQNTVQDPKELKFRLDENERIKTIECGYQHAIALSSFGKIYTWGSNNEGQLGHGGFDSELSPRILQIDLQNYKAAQISAGYSHCIVMLEKNKNIYWFGTCGNLTNQTKPILYDYYQKLPDLFGKQEENIQQSRQQEDFAIVKINCSWSNSMSISSMLIADLRTVKEYPHEKLENALEELVSQWDTKDIMPPYIDKISEMFPENIMRKPFINNDHDINSIQNPLQFQENQQYI